MPIIPENGNVNAVARELATVSNAIGEAHAILEDYAQGQVSLQTVGETLERVSNRMREAGRELCKMAE